MNWWWVNHKQSRAQEVGGGYLWAPKANKDNSRNQTYSNMTRVKPGDIVFSYAEGKIGAIGLAMEQAIDFPKPLEYGMTGIYWADSGWLVSLKFMELQEALRPKENIATIRRLLPKKYSPIQQDGNGNQKCYLAEIPEALGYLLLDLIGDQGHSIISELKEHLSVEEQIKSAEFSISADQYLGETEKKQLILARRGQGIFRAKVLAIENRCRVTGVRDQKHLRASHIKPWRLATNEERLDGHNGLLLSPHIDHLFDRGYLSFADNGELLISRHLAEDILLAWRLTKDIGVEAFTNRQKDYMSFHLQYIFRK